MSFDQRSLIHREVWFLPCFVRQNQSKNNLFLRRDFRPLPNKNVPIWDHFYPLLFPKDSESLKILDIGLREVGAKRRLNGTSKVNIQTNKHTDRQTDISTYRKHRPRGPMLWKDEPWLWNRNEQKIPLQLIHFLCKYFVVYLQWV